MSEEVKESFKARASRRGSMFQPKRDIPRDSTAVFSSILSMQEQQKKNRPQYLNTYKMEPDKKSNMTKIKNSMQKCIEKCCEDQSFEEVCERELIRTINNQLHNKVRDLVPDRYRFIVQVVVCERNDNDFSISSRSLMNNSHDSYTSVSYAKGDLVVVGICHVIYLE